MIIGIPTELKVRENRVGAVPGGVELLTRSGHQVLVQKGAGSGAGIADSVYLESGAEIVETAEEVWARADMIVKVKEPIEEEYSRMREGQIIYTYLHLAADKRLTEVLLEKGVRAIAYETIELADGSLPLLRPMSEVAGRMAVQMGAHFLEKHQGGKGVLLGGVPGVKRGRVAILGGGIVGVNSAKMAIGLGAEVTILDVNQGRLAYLDDIFGNKVNTLMSNPENIALATAESDLLIGAVLLTGAKAPTLVTEDMVKGMEGGSVIVDVAIDQGGSIATIKPTTHDEPVYVIHGVNHYGVTNIPGAVPKTSTYALSNVTLPFGLELANRGIEKCLEKSQALRAGLNAFDGKLTNKAVADATGLPYTEY